MPNRPRPLLIFAKAPVPGRVKTRLIPALGAKGACELYIQLLRHSLQQTIDWPAQRYLYAPQIDHPLLQQLAKDHNLTLRQQVGADLGERMANALAEHPDGALLIGTDCPDMSTAVVQQANIALATHDGRGPQRRWRLRVDRPAATRCSAFHQHAVEPRPGYA
mgnify:CR=1 FL=1